jgi:hypothetical protein
MIKKIIRADGATECLTRKKKDSTDGTVMVSSRIIINI